MGWTLFPASFRPEDQERRVKPGAQQSLRRTRRAPLPCTRLARQATIARNNGRPQPRSPTPLHAATSRLSIRPRTDVSSRQENGVAGTRTVCVAAGAASRLRIGHLTK